MFKIEKYSMNIENHLLVSNIKWLSKANNLNKAANQLKKAVNQLLKMDNFS